MERLRIRGYVAMPEMYLNLSNHTGGAFYSIKCSTLSFYLKKI